MSAPIPSPAVKRLTAAELLTKVRDLGGRVYRMGGPAVFCLTDSLELADWLKTHGAAPSSHADADGGYRRSDGKREFDLQLHQIPLEGDAILAELLA